MWVTPLSGSTSCGAAGLQQRGGQPQGVRHHHVVVGQAVQDQQRTGQLGRVGEQRVALVDLRRLVRVTEVPLGVEGVVEPHVGDRSAGDGGVEHVRAAQHGQRGQVAAERPAADPHPGQVEVRHLLRQRLQPLDLVVQGDRRQLVAHRAVPLRPTTAGPAAVDLDDSEAAVGDPLRQQPRLRLVQHLAVVRAAVGVHQHRQRGAGHVVPRQHEADREVVRADPEELRRRRQRRLLGVRRESALLLPVAPDRHDRQRRAGPPAGDHDGPAGRPGRCGGRPVR